MKGVGGGGGGGRGRFGLITQYEEGLIAYRVTLALIHVIHGKTLIYSSSLSCIQNSILVTQMHSRFR